MMSLLGAPISMLDMQEYTKATMRLLGSVLVALGVLWFVDMELNQGRYANAALTVARGVMRSIGFD